MTMLSGVNIETREFEEFSVGEVYFVDLFKPKITAKNGILQFHTEKGKFLGLVTLEDIKEHWLKFGFMPLDSVNVINVNKIAYIVEETFFVSAIFENGTSASISRNRLHMIDHLNIPRKRPV